MSLENNISIKIKEAMKSKNKLALETLRAIKAELLKVQTASGSKAKMSSLEEIKLLHKMQKQRKDAFAIYEEQGRNDLAEEELAQTKVIEKFLPKQMTSSELEVSVAKIIKKVGASNLSDFGRVMAIASKELAGKAQGKTISSTVKMILNML